MGPKHHRRDGGKAVHLSSSGFSHCYRHLQRQPFLSPEHVPVKRSAMLLAMSTTRAAVALMIATATVTQACQLVRRTDMQTFTLQMLIPTRSPDLQRNYHDYHCSQRVRYVHRGNSCRYWLRRHVIPGRPGEDRGQPRHRQRDENHYHLLR